ncbi:hypothetical protein [Brevibacillus agri]|uniref:hypothetical protein n=1 Tax=Brevibacillus agri TaxID=51101 RepID=UPI003D20D516
MTTTPKTKQANTPQPRLKAIQQPQEIAVRINRRVSGDDLGKMLQGVMAFTQCFDAGDEYEVTLQVDKVMKEDEAHEPTV